jgi:hypothetical protein
MHFFTIGFPLLAAMGSLAAPQGFVLDISMTVTLQNSETDPGSLTTFQNDGSRQTLPLVGSSGPFSIVELNVGSSVVPQDQRCQIRDENNDVIRVTRGPNNDTSFSDGDGGIWRFDAGPKLVSAVICDPDFVKDEEDFEIRIFLSDGENLATQTVTSSTIFMSAGLESEVREPLDASGPFNTVALDIGADVKQQTLRCQILDNNGNAIEIKRGVNEDFTFADGGNGLWNFLNPTSSEVSQIICDPAFVSA